MEWAEVDAAAQQRVRSVGFRQRPLRRDRGETFEPWSQCIDPGEIDLRQPPARQRAGANPGRKFPNRREGDVRLICRQWSDRGSAKIAANPAPACGSSAAADRSGSPLASNCRSGASVGRSLKRSGPRDCQPSARVRPRYRRCLQGVRRLRCRQSKPLRFSLFPRGLLCLADQAQRRPPSLAVNEEKSRGRVAWRRKFQTTVSRVTDKRGQLRGPPDFKASRRGRRLQHFRAGPHAGLADDVRSKNHVRAADLRSILDLTSGPGRATQN